MKPQFAKSTEIEDLSVNFNMVRILFLFLLYTIDVKFFALNNIWIQVNALDDDEPAEDIYKPDGGYIPRVLFINPDGNVMDDVINEGGNAKYKVCWQYFD